MQGLPGRIRDAVVRRLVIRAVEKLMMPALNSLRDDISGGTLPPVHTADAFFRRAPLMLVTTAEPFEYPHPDWGERIRMIGALNWEPPGDHPAWLQRLEEPAVLVTTSSEYQADETLVGTALKGLANEGFSVVATVPAARTGSAGAGRAPGTEGYGELPANAFVEHFVPHGLVLKRAAVAITHGGMGSTQKALSYGVPVVVVPFGRDQKEVAARVVAADAGVRLDSRKLNPESLRQAVREATGKADGARRVAAGFRTAGGATTGADALEELLLRR
jgi:MGT family glycosyltransferase